MRAAAAQRRESALRTPPPGWPRWLAGWLAGGMDGSPPFPFAAPPTNQPPAASFFCQLVPRRQQARGGNPSSQILRIITTTTLKTSTASQGLARSLDPQQQQHEMQCTQKNEKSKSGAGCRVLGHPPSSPPRTALSSAWIRRLRITTTTLTFTVIVGTIINVAQYIPWYLPSVYSEKPDFFAIVPRSYLPWLSTPRAACFHPPRCCPHSADSEATSVDAPRTTPAQMPRTVHSSCQPRRSV